MLKRKRETQRDTNEERRHNTINKCNRFLSGYIGKSSLLKLLQDENFWLKDQSVCACLESQPSSQLKSHQNGSNRRKPSKKVKKVTFATEVVKIEIERDEETVEENETEEEVEKKMMMLKKMDQKNRWIA
ncbi:hypothetical protein BD560DRAFT_429409 [Blakeslea trispora]|nr:hypothetical protein BD560DRAFT_429409 [Blakeslea trispora]